MSGNFLFGISLTASFLAGLLALFAPCCITFLFPSYLGTIFKEGKKVIFYTLLFALGLAFVLVPIAFGFRFFVFILSDYHQQVYYIGGVIMILMGIATVKPFFHIPSFFQRQSRLDKKVDAGSAFALGLLSGLTSACCAPVLFAAVTLTTLSPTLVQALAVSFAYVLGIVFPLFVLSLSYKQLTAKISGGNRQKIYDIFKMVGAGIFGLSGILIIVFNYQHKIVMDQMEGYSRIMRLIVFQVAKHFQNPVVDIGTFLLIVFIFYKLLRVGKRA